MESDLETKMKEEIASVFQVTTQSYQGRGQGCGGYHIG